MLAALALRLGFPNVDPPFEYDAFNYTITGELFTFEGNAWAQDARNKALFDKWVLDKWPTSLLMPLHNLACYLAFRLFGVGLWQVRLPSMLFGLFVTVLLYQILRRTDDEITGLLAAYFWGFNYLAVALNKTALIESGLIFMTVAAYGLWHFGRRTAAGCFLFGLTAVLCVLYKPTGLIIPATGLCMYLLEAWRTKSWRNLLLFLCGAGLAGGIYLIAFQSRLAEIFTFYGLIGNAWRPKSSVELFMSAATFMISRYFFFRQPILSTAALIWLAWLFSVCLQTLNRKAAENHASGETASRSLPFPYALLHADSPLRLADLYLALWFISGLAMPLAEGGQNPMLRRYMFLLPPMAIMSAKLLRALLNSQTGVIPAKGPAALVLFLCGYIAGFSCLRILFFQNLPAFRSAHLDMFLMVFTGAVLAGLLAKRAAPGIGRLASALTARKTVCVASILGVYFLVQGSQLLGWALDRQYTLLDSNQRLAAIEALQQPVIVAGNTLTISAGFHSRYRPLVVGSPPDYMNWQNILTSPRIEYYLLNQAPYHEDNPILMPFLSRYPDSIPIAEVTIGNREAIIYRKIDNSQ